MAYTTPKTRDDDSTPSPPSPSQTIDPSRIRAYKMVPGTTSRRATDLKAALTTTATTERMLRALSSRTATTTPHTSAKVRLSPIASEMLTTPATTLRMITATHHIFSNNPTRLPPINEKKEPITIGSSDEGTVAGIPEFNQTPPRRPPIIAWPDTDTRSVTSSTTASSTPSTPPTHPDTIAAVNLTYNNTPLHSETITSNDSSAPLPGAIATSDPTFNIAAPPAKKALTTKRTPGKSRSHFHEIVRRKDYFTELADAVITTIDDASTTAATTPAPKPDTITIPLEREGILSIINTPTIPNSQHILGTAQDLRLLFTDTLRDMNFHGVDAENIILSPKPNKISTKGTYLFNACPLEKLTGDPATTPDLLATEIERICEHVGTEEESTLLIPFSDDIHWRLAIVKANKYGISKITLWDPLTNNGELERINLSRLGLAPEQIKYEYAGVQENGWSCFDLVCQKIKSIKDNTSFTLKHPLILRDEIATEIEANTHSIGTRTEKHALAPIENNHELSEKITSTFHFNTSKRDDLIVVDLSAPTPVATESTSTWLGWIGQLTNFITAPFTAASDTPSFTFAEPEKLETDSETTLKQLRENISDYQATITLLPTEEKSKLAKDLNETLPTLIKLAVKNLNDSIAIYYHHPLRLNELQSALDNIKSLLCIIATIDDASKQKALLKLFFGDKLELSFLEQQQFFASIIAASEQANKILNGHDNASTFGSLDDHLNQIITTSNPTEPPPFYFNKHILWAAHCQNKTAGRLTFPNLASTTSLPKYENAHTTISNEEGANAAALAFEELLGFAYDLINSSDTIPPITNTEAKTIKYHSETNSIQINHTKFLNLYERAKDPKYLKKNQKEAAEFALSFAQAFCDYVENYIDKNAHAPAELMLQSTYLLKLFNNINQRISFENKYYEQIIEAAERVRAANAVLEQLPVATKNSAPIAAGVGELTPPQANPNQDTKITIASEPTGTPATDTAATSSTTPATRSTNRYLRPVGAAFCLTLTAVAILAGSSPYYINNQPTIYTNFDCYTPPQSNAVLTPSGVTADGDLIFSSFLRPLTQGITCGTKQTQWGTPSSIKIGLPSSSDTSIIPLSSSSSRLLSATTISPECQDFNQIVGPLNSTTTTDGNTIWSLGALNQTALDYAANCLSAAVPPGTQNLITIPASFTIGDSDHAGQVQLEIPSVIASDNSTSATPSPSSSTTASPSLNTSTSSTTSASDSTTPTPAATSPRPSKTATPIPTNSATPSKSANPSSSPTISGTNSLSVSPTPKSTSSQSNTLSPSATETNSETRSSSTTAIPSTTTSGTRTNSGSTASSASTTQITSATETNSQTETTTSSESTSSTATISATPSTIKLSDSSTATITQTDTNSYSITITNSNSASASTSNSASISPTKAGSTTTSATPSTTVRLSASLTATFTQTNTNSQTITITNSISSSASVSATASASGSTSTTNSVTVTTTDSGSVTVTPSHSNSVTISVTPSASPSATTSASDSATTTNSVTLSVTNSGSVTITPSKSNSVSIIVTPSSSASATTSATQSVTVSVSNSGSITITPSSSVSPTATDSASKSATTTNSATQSVTASLTNSGSVTITSSTSGTNSVTITPSSSASETTSASSSTSATTSATQSVTISVTNSGSVTTTPSNSNSVSVTITPSASPTATASASDSASATNSVTVTTTNSGSVTVTPSHSNSVTVSVTPSASPSATVSASDSASATNSVTVTTTNSGSVTVSVTPSASPSATTSASGSPSATQSVTVSTSNSGSVTVSVTPSLSPSPSDSSSATQSVTVSTTNSGSVTVTSSHSNSVTVSVTPSASPSPSDSSSATQSITVSTTNSGSATNSVTVTTTNSGSVTITPSRSNSVTVSVTPSPSATASASDSTSATNSVTVTTTNSGSVTVSVTPSPSPSATTSASGSASTTNSVTVTTTNSGSVTITPSHSNSVTVSVTPSPSPSATTSASDSASATNSVTATTTNSGSVTITPSHSNSVTVSVTPSASPSATTSASDSASATNSVTVTTTNSGSVTITPSHSNSVTISVTPSASPSATTSASDSASATQSVTASVSNSGSVTVSVTPSASPSATTSASDSASATQSVTVTTTNSGSATITVTPSPSPSPSATTSASGSPSTTNSGSVTITPSNSNSVSVTITPSPSPSATVSASGSASATNSVTVTTTNSGSVTITPSHSNSVTVSVTPSASPSATTSASDSNSATSSVTTSASTSASVTITQSNSRTASITVTPSPSSSATATTSISSSPSTSPTSSISNSASITPSVTITISVTPTPSPSPSSSITTTSTPTNTDTSTASSTSTGTGTATASATPSSSSSATPSISPSNSGTAVTPSSSPTACPSIALALPTLKATVNNSTLNAVSITGMDVSTRNGASNALIQISSTQPTHIRVIANATGVTQVNSGLIQFYASNITDQTNAGIEAVAHTTILGGLTNQAGVILVNLTTFKPDGTVDCASYTWMSYRGGHLLRMLESNESITIPTTTTVFHDAHPHLRGHATIDREP